MNQPTKEPELECPYVQRRLAGDETYDICKINTKPCLIEHGLYECETWNVVKADILSLLRAVGATNDQS